MHCHYNVFWTVHPLCANNPLAQSLSIPCSPYQQNQTAHQAYPNINSNSLCLPTFFLLSHTSLPLNSQASDRSNRGLARSRISGYFADRIWIAFRFQICPEWSEWRSFREPPFRYTIHVAAPLVDVLSANCLKGVGATNHIAFKVVAEAWGFTNI